MAVSTFITILLFCDFLKFYNLFGAPKEENRRDTASQSTLEKEGISKITIFVGGGRTF